MKIFKNKHFIITANPNRVSEKAPTHYMYLQGKKKDGNTFMIKVAALWSDGKGQIKGTMLEGNTNPNTGKYYYGHSIVNDEQLQEKQEMPPVEQMSFQDL